MTKPLCLVVDDWPEVDRERWRRAQEPAGFLEDDKPASRWSAARRRIVEQAHGQWLAFLDRNGMLDPSCTPGECATDARLSVFVTELRARVAPVSAAMMLGALVRMLSVLEPGRDWGPLARVYNHLRQTAAPSRDKPSRLVRASHLFELGLRLMESCEEGADRPGYVPTRYRDGLIIALLIACPMRIKNLANLVIGQHLVFDGCAYGLKLSAAETKTGRPYVAAVPLELTPYIDGWLQVHREALQSIATGKGEVGGSHLWLNRHGRPMHSSANPEPDRNPHTPSLRQVDLAASVPGLRRDRAGRLRTRGDRHRPGPARPRRPPDYQEALHPGGRDAGACPGPRGDRRPASRGDIQGQHRDITHARMAGVNHAVPLAQDSLDSAVRLHENRLDATGTPQMDVSTWLRDLGLENYAQAFQANHIDAEVLPRLTADDLTALGITSVGHRRRLLDAIAALDQESGPAAAEPTTVAARPLKAERRQLTVLFCDLVGSTELAAQLDPEDMGQVIRAYHGACTEVVERWGGQVAKYMGDGVLAYFGWPQAHEDDAERAVRTGLELADDVGKLDTPAGKTLAARIGIATGLVMVGELIGEGAAKEQTVVGETPSRAARLQALAEPGSVVIDSGCQQLVGGLFEYADLGMQDLKGFAGPVQAWRVLGESRAESRFDALHGKQLTALVGREHEIGLLVDRWECAKEGEGQVVLLSGEPGIGKSRIVRALRERLAGEPHTPLSHYCSPHHTNSALYPVIGLLERAAGFSRNDRADAKLDKLQALLTRSTEALDEAVPLVAALLGIETGERYPVPALSPQRQKQRTLEVLVDQVKGLAGRQPVLVVYEDVHWVDPTTLEALDLLVERAQGLPVLVLITFRPEFSPPWTGHAHVMQLSLSRLTRRHGQALVAAVTGGKTLPDEVLDQILAKTDGVPLFVEELTKAVLESGLLRDAGQHYELAGPLVPLAIPATLQDSLMARLDRLAPVKEVAQIGAVIGREFSHALLAGVSPLPEDQLSQALDQLVASELVFRRGTPPEATYTFKHALVQDAAYQSLLKVRRQQLHALIAQVLEQHFPETAPEVLAYHLTEAQQYEEAVPKWLAAGQAATARSAYAEAAANLRRGVDVVARVADPTRRVREEIQLQNALGFALIARGPVPDVAEAYERARSLCSEVDMPRELFAARFGLWFFNHLRLDLEGTAKFSDELLAMVEGESDGDLVLEAHHAAWTTGWPRGELEKSLDHAAAGIRLYRPEVHHRLANVYAGHDPGVCARYSHGLVSWLLGFPDRAADRVEEALALAHKLQHPFTLAVTLAFASLVRQFRREPKCVRELSQQIQAHCTEQSFPVFVPQGLILEDWALAVEGQVQQGNQQMRDGLASLRAMGANVRRSYYLGLLAEACLRATQYDAGLEAASEALDLIETSGERWWQAELYRLQGDLLLAQNGNDQAHACSCFECALDISIQQKAKSLELRAATSLARLWADQGNRAQAHELLAPVYGWFTEGFDTADLKDAKALLDELA